MPVQREERDPGCPGPRRLRDQAPAPQLGQQFIDELDLLGWVTVEETKRGSKHRYIDQRGDAQAKAVEYLAGQTAGDLADRTLALLLMAVYADEKAVANSNRAFHT
jgi:hypothetical protein